MLRPTLHPWDRFVGRVRDRIEDTVERVADAIKDFLLDAGTAEDADFTRPAAEDPPPFSREDFLAALRPRVEETLGRLADVLNETPGGQLSAACEEHLTNLFARLWCEALQLGQQMRSDAVHAVPAPFKPAPGEWARRYRRMQPVSPGRLPFRSGPGNHGSL